MQQVALILVGILALGALVLLALQSRRRSPWRGPAAPSRTARASPRFDDLDPGEERSPATSEFGPYRVRPGSSLH
ncbi:MAG: hypothetical protein ACRDFX_00255 [Chloroflexota bacterium]